MDEDEDDGDERYMVISAWTGGRIVYFFLAAFFAPFLAAFFTVFLAAAFFAAGFFALETPPAAFFGAAFFGEAFFPFAAAIVID